VAAYRLVYDYACGSLWAWLEVMAAHHRVHDYACCHLHSDCLESGISSGPFARLRIWVPLPLSEGHLGHYERYPTSKVLTAIPLTLSSAHLTPALLRKAVLLSRAAVPSPIEKVYIPSVR